MKVAVTGATGFVGRHVVDELLRRGLAPVLICRDRNALTPRAPGSRVVEMDLLAPPENVFHAIGRPDVLIHLAWSGLPNYQSSHHEEQVSAHFRFLRALVEGGLKNLVVTGTCFEYGMQSGELREDLETRPANAYGRAKDSLRHELESLQRVRRFNLTWARLFYLYGSGQSSGSLYSQLRSAVAQGAESFDMSGGEQLRDYLPVEEAASHLVSLSTQNRNVGCVNVCSGKPISVKSVVEQWIRNNNWSIELNLGRYPYAEHEPMQFWGASEKLHQYAEQG